MPRSGLVVAILTASWAAAAPACADIKTPSPGTTAPKLKCTTVKEWVCTAKPGEGGKLSDCHWETSQRCIVVKNSGIIRN